MPTRLNLNPLHTSHTWNNIHHIFPLIASFRRKGAKPNSHLVRILPVFPDPCFGCKPTFVVGIGGEISDIQVVENTAGDCDQAAIKMVNSMPPIPASYPKNDTPP